MDHWSVYMQEFNAQQQCFNYDFHGSEQDRGCYEANCMPMTTQNMDYGMGNVMCEQDSYSQAQTEGLHEDNSDLKELLAQFTKDMKVIRDNSQVSCKNILESCMEEVVDQNEDNFKELLGQSLDDFKVYSHNFEASCRNIDAHFQTIMEHLKEESCIEEVVDPKLESCIEYVVEQEEEKESVGYELECGQLEIVEENQKSCVVVEKEKFKNSDKEEKPRLRYEKSHVTIEIQPLVIEEKIPPQNELQLYQERENSYPKCLLVGASEHLLPYAKYMGFLTKKRKRKDVFFLSYYPP